jgi:hypothetical protein
MDVDAGNDSEPNAGAIDNDEDNFTDSPAAKTTGNKCCWKNTDATAAAAKDKARPLNLDPQDPGNFLKLSKALQILVLWTITEEELVVADQLLHEYCTELITVSFPLPTSPASSQQTSCV